MSGTHRFSLRVSIKMALIIITIGTSLLFIQASMVSGFDDDDINYSYIQSLIEFEEEESRSDNWYDVNYEAIIIVRDQANEIAAMQKLADWKTEKGVPTKIVNQTEFMSYEGRDTPEKIRNCIKDYYLNYSIQWVLLAGDTNLIPIRYTYNPDTFLLNNFDEPKGSQEYKPTDYYYADLTGDWDTDKDGKFGESLLYSTYDEIDWNPEVYVGRFPGINADELEDMVDKTIAYENITTTGDWMNRILMAGAIQKTITSEDPDGEEEGALMEKIIQESITSKMDITRLYESQGNLTWAYFNSHIDQGNSIVAYAGHGDITKLDKLGFGQDFFTTVDAQVMLNTNMLSLIFADACLTNWYDDDYHTSLGEYLIKNPNAGAIGYIGGMRLTWFYGDSDKDWIVPNDGIPDDEQMLCEMNRGMTRLFFKEMFQNGYYQQGKALYEMKRTYVNNWWWMLENPMNGPNDAYDIHSIEWERKNVLTYNLLGDPETDIYTEVPRSFDRDGSYGGITGIFNTTSGYYEGEEIQLVIQDSYAMPVKNARLCVIGEDGAYNYYYSDNGGNIVIRLPQKIQSYNFTVTAHNMITLKGTFDTIEDSEDPIILSAPKLTPEKPDVDCNIHIEASAQDQESGIHQGYFVLSLDNFVTFDIYPVESGTEQNILAAILPKLDYGNYKYVFYVYDNAGNSNHTFWTNNDSFNIPMPIIAGIIVSANLGIVVAISAFIIKKKSLIIEFERNSTLG